MFLTCAEAATKAYHAGFHAVKNAVAANEQTGR
jgi:hypothetical protein